MDSLEKSEKTAKDRYSQARSDSSGANMSHAESSSLQRGRSEKPAGAARTATSQGACQGQPAKKLGKAGSANKGKATNKGAKTNAKAASKTPVPAAAETVSADAGLDLAARMEKLEKIMEILAERDPRLQIQHGDQTQSQSQPVPASAASMASAAAAYPADTRGPPVHELQPQDTEEFHGGNSDYQPARHDYEYYYPEVDDSTYLGNNPELNNKGMESEPELPPLAAKFAPNSSAGKPLDSQLASSINYLMLHKLDEKNMQDTADKYLCPENCQALDVPKVNTTIWDNLKTNTRTKDAKLQRVQRALARGINAFAQSLDGCQLTESQHDALALLCNAHFELTGIRKDFIRPEINPKYAHLCKAGNVQSPKYLFGEDLSKQVKELNEEHKAAVGVVKATAGKQYRDRSAYQYKPYPASAHNTARYREAGWTSRRNPQGQHPFLGAGAYRTPQSRRRGHGAPHTQSRPPAQEGKKKGRDQLNH